MLAGSLRMRPGVAVGMSGERARRIEPRVREGKAGGLVTDRLCGSDETRGKQH
jgi:hypothetical protein